MLFWSVLAFYNIVQNIGINPSLLVKNTVINFYRTNFEDFLVLFKTLVIVLSLKL